MDNLSHLKQQFLTHLLQDRGRSPSTIKNYDRNLREFLICVNVETLSELREKHLEQFKQHIKNKPGKSETGESRTMSQNGQNHYLVTLRRFLVFLNDQGLTTLSPSLVPLTVITTKPLNLTPYSQLQKLLLEPKIVHLEGKRDLTLLQILLTTGVSVTELCQINLTDFNLERSQCVINQGTKKERWVYLDDETKQALLDYLQHRDDTQPALFIRYGHKQHVGADKRIQVRAVQRLLQKYAAQAGITGEVNPQNIRHAYIIHLLENGVSKASLMKLLGYTNDVPLKKYVLQPSK